MQASDAPTREPSAIVRWLSPGHVENGGSGLTTNLPVTTRVLAWPNSADQHSVHESETHGRTADWGRSALLRFTSQSTWLCAMCSRYRHSVHALSVPADNHTFHQTLSHISTRD